MFLQRFTGSLRVLFPVGVMMKQGHHMVVDEEKLETETDTAHLMNPSVFADIMLFKIHNTLGVWVVVGFGSLQT